MNRPQDNIHSKKGAGNTKSFISPDTDDVKTKSNAIGIPTIPYLRRRCLKGIDEKFSVNAVNGTSSFSIPFQFHKQEAYLLIYRYLIIQVQGMEFLVWAGIFL